MHPRSESLGKSGVQRQKRDEAWPISSFVGFRTFKHKVTKATKNSVRLRMVCVGNLARREYLGVVLRIERGVVVWRLWTSSFGRSPLSTLIDWADGCFGRTAHGVYLVRGRIRLIRSANWSCEWRDWWVAPTLRKTYRYF